MVDDPSIPSCLPEIDAAPTVPPTANLLEFTAFIKFDPYAFTALDCITYSPFESIAGIRSSFGPPGPNTIGGYGINITSVQNYDALMFRTTTNTWQNVPQEEISDGGNF